MEYRLLYITAGSADEARTLARTLVEERLVACANILNGISSVYWWKGTVQESAEVLLVAKTRQECVDAVVVRIRNLHSYSCPCVVAVPITEGNPDYLAWIGAETSGAAG